MRPPLRMSDLPILAVAAVCTMARAAFAQAPPNDLCSGAIVLTCGQDVNLLVNTTTANNNYDIAGNCVPDGFPTQGPDIVYRIDLPPWASVELTLDSSPPAGSGHDAALYLITDCSNPGGSCLVGSDVHSTSLEFAEYIFYTNDTESTLTTFLIVDGFRGISTPDRGVATLTGSIRCSTGPAIGACCSPMTATCSVMDSAVCVGTGGAFQGQGTGCGSTSCPSLCILPGLVVATDPAGDHDSALGTRQSDIRNVWIAEPQSATGFVVTMEVDSLASTAAGLPANHQWSVLWTNPYSGSDLFRRKFVQMNTCDATSPPTYAYGHVEVNSQTGARTLAVEGTTTGGFDAATRQIHVDIDPAQLRVSVGDELLHLAAETRLGVGESCAGAPQPIDGATRAFRYTARGNTWCRPHTVSCPAASADPPGDKALTFQVTNPSTATRTYDVTLGDTWSWIVGGPISSTVGPVTPGGTGSLTVTARTAADCNPSIDDVFTFTATANDLPHPAGVKTCATTLTCLGTTGVADAAATTLSFAMAGANPFRGGTTLSYSLPRRSHVKIEVFSVTGQRVRTLVDDEYAPGPHSVAFQLGEGGTALRAGLYMAKISAGAESRTLRLLARD